MVVLARLQDFDSSLYEAALDLGAGRFNAMRLVVIPLVFPGILAGGIMAFTLSIDDFVITFFVSGAGAATLPGYIYSMMKHGFPAVINSLSVLFVIATFFLVLMSRKFLVKQ
jgi:spermidine/putrescine transport system permease protein